MRKHFLIILTALLVALCAPNAQADDIVQVDISNLTFSGNNACGPIGTSPCIETLNASFLWDNTTGAPVAGSVQSAITGPVPFTFGQPGLVPSPVQPSVFVVFLNGDDSFQDFLFVNIVFQGSVLNPGDYPANPINQLLPGTTNAGLECQETHPGSCFPEFGMLSVAAQGSTIVTSTPEPDSLPLVSFSVLGLALMLKKTTR